jgi:phenylpropionate dioxygenase-like ring-hydroxylating dioxygenase large terminal subunit
MSILDHWHPVLKTSDLARGSVRGVKLGGHSIAVFRAMDGKLGAIDDKCVHRRMKLSLGTIEDDRLVCRYHGWSFARDGQGRSPSTPYMHACIVSFDCGDANGAIWIKRPGIDLPLPCLAIEGWKPVGVVINRIKAPLELVIDNFSEVEHTVAAHPDFGFDARKAGNVVVQLDLSDDSITVRNQGPAKMPPVGTRVLAWVRPGDQFHSNYTFRFDPPRSSVSHFWTNPESGRERMSKYHLFHYFVPEDAKNTLIVTFGYFQSRWPIFAQIGPHVGWFVRHKIRTTVDEDALILENLADDSTHLDGMKLSRFDRVLGLTRERIHRIYYGDTESQKPTAHAGTLAATSGVTS